MSGDGRVALLAGGTGFLGVHVARALSRRGWRLRLLCRRPPDHPMLSDLDVAVVGCDLARGAPPPGALAGCDLVVNAAGLVKARDLDAFLGVNRDGAGGLAAAAAREAPGARLIHLSSQAAREPALSPYALSKRAGEAAVRDARGAAPTVILRPGVVYGKWDREGAALLALAAWPLVPVPRPPEPRLAMLHARDLADAVARFAEAQAPVGLFELADAAPDGHALGEILRHAAGAPRRAVAVPDRAFLLAGTLAEAASRLRRRPSLFGPGKAREILHRDWRPDPVLRPPAAVWRPRIGLAEGFAELRREGRPGPAG